MLSARRVVVPLGLGLSLLAGSASAVLADKPTRGCSDDFQLMSLLDFRALLNSADYYASLPPEGQALAPALLESINSDAWLSAGTQFDKNGDGQLCLKQDTITRGHLWGWVWNAIDNTKNSG